MGLDADPYPATGLSSPVRLACDATHVGHNRVCALYCVLYVFVKRVMEDVVEHWRPTLPHFEHTQPQQRSTFLA
jgi:hypothetical protein